MRGDASCLKGTQDVRRNLVQRQIRVGEFARQVPQPRDLHNHFAGQFLLNSEIELLRISHRAMGIEETDRGRRSAGRGLRDRHGPERIVERRIRQRGNAILQQEDRRNAIVRSGQARVCSKAERDDVAWTVVKGMRKKQPKSATHRCRGREGLPGKTYARAEVCPPCGIRRLRPPVYADELHRARCSGSRIDLVRIKAVHVEIVGDHGSIRFPSETEVQRQVAGDGPVVLRETCKVVHMPLEV